MTSDSMSAPLVIYRWLKCLSHQVHKSTAISSEIIIDLKVILMEKKLLFIFLHVLDNSFVIIHILIEYFA